MMPSYDELKKKEISQDHLQLLNHVKEMVRLSREHMQKKYSDWDHYDEIYRGIRMMDTEDKKANEKKEPIKMVVPLGYAQLQTFVAFCFTLFTQREYFYNLIGSSPEDFKAAEIGEALLQRDLDHNKFGNLLYQWLLDIGRFGLGIMKDHWVEETQMIEQNLPPKTLSFLGLSMTLRSAKTQKVPAIKFQGNKLQNVSPYRFFPDPRIPLSRFQEGEWVASEEEYSSVDLKQMEAEGVVAGVDYIQQFRNPDVLRRTARNGFVDVMTQMTSAIRSNVKPAIINTEIVAKIIPSKFKLDNKPIGEEDYPVKYLIWYANDSRIIRCEPFSYLHDQFPYTLGEMSPDMNHFLNSGLLESIDELQDVISWFINSHVRSVRRTIDNQLIVDPVGIVMDDLKNHRPVIRLQPDASRSGVERWIKQLEVRDVTGNHVQDAAFLQKMIETVTGINDNLLGQFHGGRRSATEARNVTASAGSRLKVISSILWTGALEPLGRQMLSNLRDGLTVQTYVRIFGSAAEGGSFQQFKQISRQDLVGDYDFAVFDGTLPSEKEYKADILMQLVEMLFGNPMAMQLLGLDPRMIVMDILRMKGIKYPERYSIQNNPQAMAQMLQMQQMTQQNGQQNGQPNGNQAPVRGNGNVGKAPASQRMDAAPGNDLLAGLVRGGGE
jgi:hypothetical protein